MYLGLTALCQFTQNFPQNFPVCHFRFSDFFQEQQEGHHWGWEGFFCLNLFVSWNSSFWLKPLQYTKDFFKKMRSRFRHFHPISEYFLPVSFCSSNFLCTSFVPNFLVYSLILICWIKIHFSDYGYKVVFYLSFWCLVIQWFVCRILVTPTAVH